MRFRSGSRDAAPDFVARRERVTVGLADESYAILRALDAPARDGVERGCAYGLARSEAEARVMPGTANRVLDKEALGKRPAVVRAGGPDREDLVATSSEQHALALRMAEEHRAVGNVGEWYA
jgi:hypothetical protein